ncbi:MAG TPA: hypothetical protein PK771_04830, partial [Spirochaetota bacterium]|nr:hypothetical protein [Spirochaetota bacterium]
MKFRYRILIGYFILIFLFVILMIYNINIMKKNSLMTKDIVEKKFLMEKEISNCYEIVLSLNSDVWNVMLFELTKRDDMINNLDDMAKSFYKSIDYISENNSNFTVELKSIRNNFAGYFVFAKTILKLSSIKEFNDNRDIFDKFWNNKKVIVNQLN